MQWEGDIEKGGGQKHQAGSSTVMATSEVLGITLQLAEF